MEKILKWLFHIQKMHYWFDQLNEYLHIKNKFPMKLSFKRLSFLYTLITNKIW